MIELRQAVGLGVFKHYMLLGRPVKCQFQVHLLCHPTKTFSNLSHCHMVALTIQHVGFQIDENLIFQVSHSFIRGFILFFCIVIFYFSDLFCTMLLLMLQLVQEER